MNLKTEVVSLVGNNNELKIYNYLLPYHDSDTIIIENMDYTTMGIKSLSSKRKNGGIKWLSNYSTTESDGDVVVSKEFEYVNDGVWICHTWYTHSGDVGLYKTEFKPLNTVEIGKIKRNNRERAINYLMVSGDDMRTISNNLTLEMFSSQAELDYYKSVYIDIAESIDILLNYFKYEIDVFILRGLPLFLNKVNDILNDVIVDVDIKGRLLKSVESAPSELYPSVKRVKDAIFEQVTINY